MNMHRLTLVGLSSAVLSLLTYACSGGDGGGSATPDAGDPAETGASDRAVENGDAAATGDDGGDAGTATSSDASSDAKAPDGGVCTPAWDGTLSFPAKGTRFVTGWQLVSATAPSAYVQSLSGTSATDVWYTGQMWGGKTSSFVAHYDGTSVRALLGLPQTTWPVAPVSANEVWLGPDLRYKDGVLARSPASAPGELAMKFFATDDGWSVGAGGIWRWSGATWAAHGTKGSAVPFTTVDGDASNDVWVAAGSLVLRWNGAEWLHPPELPDGVAVTKLRVNGPTDVWAIGSAGLLHFDGVGWTTFSPTNGWADLESNGAKTMVLGSARLGFVEGASLVVTDASSYPCSGGGRCTDAWMTPAGQVLVGTMASAFGRSPWVGTGSASASLVEERLPAAATIAPGIATFRQLPGGDILAAAGGKLHRGTFGKWTPLTPPQTGSGETIDRLENDRGDLVWVLSTDTAGTTYASLYDGTSFGPRTALPGKPTRLRSTSKTNGWGETTAGTIRFDGSTWALATGEPAGAIHAPVSDTEAFRVVPSEGAPIEHLVSGVWTSTGVTVPAPDAFGFLAAKSAQDVIAVSAKGAVFHFDGAVWTELVEGSPAMDLIPALSVYAGGMRVYNDHTSVDMKLLTFDGVCWRSEEPTNVGDLTGSPERLFYVTRAHAESGYFQEVFTRTP